MLVQQTNDGIDEYNPVTAKKQPPYLPSGFFGRPKIKDNPIMAINAEEIANPDLFLVLSEK
jgi:hypothetical protein